MAGRINVATVSDPCALLAQLQAQLALMLSGQSVVSVETPQLGRVEFSRTDPADLYRVIAELSAQCADATGTPRLRRGPISLEACP